MRVVTIALFASFVFAVAKPSVAPELPKQVPQSKETAQNRDGIDPIITGVRVTPKQLKEWEERRKRYLECPKCVTSQPFPGD